LRKWASTAAILAPAAWLLLAPGSVSGQALYRWVDENNVIHFTDDPGRIPQKYRQESTEELRRESSKLTEEPAKAPSAAPGKKERKQAEAGTTEGEGEAEDQTDEAAGSEASPYSAAVGQAGQEVDDLGHDKAYWQDRRRYWEDRLAVAQRLHAEEEREFYRLKRRYRTREYKDVKAVRKRMLELEATIAEAQEMLASGLASEARKSGAPPGWVR
jgi:hypothetical protein